MGFTIGTNSTGLRQLGGLQNAECSGSGKGVIIGLIVLCLLGAACGWYMIKYHCKSRPANVIMLHAGGQGPVQPLIAKGTVVAQPGQRIDDKLVVGGGGGGTAGAGGAAVAGAKGGEGASGAAAGKAAMGRAIDDDDLL